MPKLSKKQAFNQAKLSLSSLLFWEQELLKSVRELEEAVNNRLTDEFTRIQKRISHILSKVEKEDAEMLALTVKYSHEKEKTMLPPSGQKKQPSIRRLEENKGGKKGSRRLPR